VVPMGGPMAGPTVALTAARTAVPAGKAWQNRFE
jgi:hypothetical protein